MLRDDDLIFNLDEICNCEFPSVIPTLYIIMSLHVNLTTKAIASLSWYCIALTKLESTCWCISLYHLIALMKLQEHFTTYLLYESLQTQAVQLVPPAVCAGMVVCSQMSGQSDIKGARGHFWICDQCSPFQLPKPFSYSYTHE